MTDRRIDQPSPISADLAAFANVAAPAPISRSCGGGCGAVRDSIGPFWCPTCRGRADESEREQARKIKIAPALASIPNAWRWATFDHPDFPRRVKLGPIDGFPARGATLHGPAGAGKTSYACALLRRYLDAPGPIGDRGDARFASARSLPTMDPTVRAALLVAPLIVLDDIGAEADMPSTRAMVSDLIAERHAWERPMLITTWLAPEAINARYGDGIARRLFERALEMRFR